MSRLINYFVYLFVIVVIMFGFVQLNNENTIFADSRAACCVAGYCDYADCDATSTVRLGPNCTEYVLTCWDCVEFGAGICQQRAQSCIDGNKKYFGKGIFLEF